MNSITKKILIGLLGLSSFLIVNVSFAAIGRDFVSSSNSNPGSSLTFSHTVSATSTGQMLLVFTDNNADAYGHFSGVTYGGDAMTFMGESHGGLSNVVAAWCLASPKTGANNIVATAINGSNYIFAEGVSYTGTNQTCNTAGTATTTVTGAASLTATITTSIDNSIGLLFGDNNQGGTTAGTNSVFVSHNLGLSQDALFQSNGFITPAGNYSMTFGYGASGNSVGVMTFLSPPSAPSVVTNNMQVFWWQ